MADVDKVYHPYVEAYKTELEFRSLYAFDSDESIDRYQKYRFGLGHSITDRFFLEGYLIGPKRPDENIKFNGFELEGKYQLTEQGKYWADLGLLVELERDNDLHEWKTSTALLFEKQYHRWIFSGNFFVFYENGIEDEFETRFNGQIKYRHTQLFEPAVELYMDENTHGIGPAVLGSTRIGYNKLKWELGLIFGIKKDTPEQNIRFMLDYEF